MFLLDDIDRLYNNFSDAVYKAGQLDKKTKELIALACSVMADCVPCVKHHGSAALSAGASKEEIAEALAITMTISAGSKKGKFSSVIDELQS